MPDKTLRERIEAEAAKRRRWAATYKREADNPKTTSGRMVGAAMQESLNLAFAASLEEILRNTEGERG